MSKRITRLLVVAALVVASGVIAWGSFAPATNDKQAPIDWDRARQIFQRVQKGESVTPEERAYLERAKAERARGAQPDADQHPPAAKPTGLIPLDQMPAGQRYKGEDGGLYGGGQNTPPSAHQRAAQAELARVVPLDADGHPAPNGKIVLLSLGMSNTTMEFSRFKQLADADPDKSRALVLVDGAQGGKDAAAWNEESAPPWGVAAERLQAAGVTPRQVQIVWLKQARIGPAQYGEFPKHVEELKGQIRANLNIARKRFPNLRVAFLSSRIYAGYATTKLNPEPYAYESAFAVRGLIQEQIKGDPRLNYDPAKGAVNAPLLLWGPYLWADGTTPRKSDGLVWKPEDLAGDGTHPSPSSGRDKVARMLLAFFKTDPNARGLFLQKSASAGK